VNSIAHRPGAWHPRPGTRILLVEDDPDVRDATEALLCGEGFRVLSCAEAEAALAVLRSGQPLDLLLTDIVLGGPLSGLDVADAACRLRPFLPGLLATGYAAPALTLGREIPKDLPLLLKPFRRADLLAAIAAAMSHPRTAAA
jgi:CheY-like chemotaxis protein